MAGVDKSDYSSRATRAARRVMIELSRVLGEHRDDAVIVGGWVPELLIPGAGHVGSTDVDLALDHEALEDPGYSTILKKLQERGYEQSEKQPFIFYREVEVGGEPVRVEVDFMAGEYGGTGRSHRTQEVQDVRARKARGCDLAFELCEEVDLEEELPEGGLDHARVRVAAFPAFLVMKAMALAGRLKEKDAWDIWFCLRHHPDRLGYLAQTLRPHADHGLMQEALSHLEEKFASPEHVGPRMVADFDQITDEEARDQRMRDAYERVSYLIEEVK